MTLFWHNHFATNVDKVGDVRLMYDQNQIFRRLGMGRFGTCCSPSPSTRPC